MHAHHVHAHHVHALVSALEHAFLLTCIYIPEKTFAALTGHGVEVEACGFITTHATDPRHVPIKLIRGQSGRTHNRGLHY